MPNEFRHLVRQGSSLSSNEGSGAVVANVASTTRAVSVELNDTDGSRDKDGYAAAKTKVVVGRTNIRNIKDDFIISIILFFCV